MAEPDDDREAVAEALQRLRERKTPIEPHDLFTALDATDSFALAYFIIEIVALEATLHRIVARHGDKSAEQLDRATLGTLVGWIEPLLTDHEERTKVVGDLRELNQLRIAVVHRLPELHEVSDRIVWRFSYLRPVTAADGQTTDERVEQETADLHVYATMAWLTREKLTHLFSAALRPRS